MQIKKYLVSDMQEAIRKIKKDLGSNAVIVSTRKVKKGGSAFGLFGKNVLEVTAAINDDKRSIKTQGDSRKFKTLTNTNHSQEIEENARVAAETMANKRGLSFQEREKLVAPIKTDIDELKEVIFEMRQGIRRNINDEATISHMRYDLAELKNLVNGLISQSGELRQKEWHENFIALYQQLTFNGMEDKFARRLIDEAQKKIPKEEKENFPFVKIFVARMMMQIIKIDQTPTLRDTNQTTGPMIMTLLGPTGVGKTTTVAKIASIEKIRHPDRKVGLITIDTFRIGAVQQLQEYAKIMKVPIRVVTEKSQLSEAIKEFSDKELIIIDTAGRSQRDEMQMSELRDFISGYDHLKNFLVLSSTTKDGDLTEITKRFGTNKIAGIIFTKLDESTTYGSIFNHAIRFRIPISFLTTGQNVPDDIELATKERLVDLVLNISGE